MTNIYDLIDKEDVDNLEKLIINESQLLDFVEDDRGMPSEIESSTALNQKENDPLKYAIMHKKAESVACILRHHRYKLRGGDLSSKADEILTFSLKNLLLRVFSLHSMNADVDLCKKDIEQSKMIWKKLIFHFIDDIHTLFQSEFILCENNKALSKTPLPLGKHLEFLFSKKIYGFQPVHLVMLLGAQEVASWIIEQIPTANLSILEECVLPDCNFYGYNAMHLAAILNLDKCMRSIATKLNNESQLKKLLESRPSDIDDNGENYTPILLASRANSVASFLVCLELGANIYSTGIYKMPLEDGSEEIINTDVLSDAMCAVCAIHDDRMLQAIIAYLKQRPLSEYYEFINNPNTNCLVRLVIAKRHDLANIMIKLAVNFQEYDFSRRCKSFEHDGITIYNTNILHMAVLIEDKELINNILTCGNREAIHALLNERCFYGLDLGLNPLSLIILKYFLKQNQKENALAKMFHFESFQAFLGEIKMPIAALEILDMLLIADVPTQYQCLIERKSSLALQVMNDTIHSLFLNLHAHNIFNIDETLILKLLRYAYQALGFNYNSLFQINSVVLHVGRRVQLEEAETSNDLEMMSSTTVFFCLRQTPPYKIAMLAFRAWRQNQP